MNCPRCGSQRPEADIFCAKCGATLQVLEERALSAFEGERRQATVVFSDLSGYTEMNERLDPEEVEAVMSKIKADAVEVVESLGGTVNQFA